MPLPGVGDRTKQCTAWSKRSGSRCKNPAVVWWGLAPTVCRMHGARKRATVRQDENHPQYKHGGGTLEAKAGRSKRLAELRELEALSFAVGIAIGPRWRGRKPVRSHD